MDEKANTTQVTQQSDDQSQGEKGKQSYGVEVAQDDAGSAEKGNQSYDAEGE